MSERTVGHKEAARILGISPGSLYNYRTLGLAPLARAPMKRGHEGPPQLRYYVSDLLAWKSSATCPTCGQHVPMRERGTTRGDDDHG